VEASHLAAGVGAGATGAGAAAGAVAGATAAAGADSCLLQPANRQIATNATKMAQMLFLFEMGMNMSISFS
jgi:hypothetical protein